MKPLALFIALGILGTPLHSSANVTVPVAACAGSLLMMPGMHESHPALVLTAGHCIGVGSFEGRFPADGEVCIDHAADGSVIVKKTTHERGERFGYRKILFASMTGTDLAVIELDVSLKHVIDRGYAVYSLAPELPRPGMTLDFESYNGMGHSTCEVEKLIAVVKEGPWTWHNSVRMKDGPLCQFQHGQSGTAGTERNSRLIYALVQTGYEGGTPCSFNNPCEVDPRTGATTTAGIDQGYAVSPRALLDCYDRARGTFDFGRASCALTGKTRP